MKRILPSTILSIFLLFSLHVKAQVPVVSKVTRALPKVDVGIKLNLSFSQLHGFPDSYKTGAGGGISAGVRKNRWGVRAEALVNTAHNPSSFAGTQHTLFLDIPVLLEYKIVGRLWAQAGPQFSSPISSTASAEGNGYKSNFSGVAGLEARLPTHFVAGARYVMGLSTAYSVNYYDANGMLIGRANATTQAFQLYVGFRFL